MPLFDPVLPRFPPHRIALLLLQRRKPLLLLDDVQDHGRASLHILHLLAQQTIHFVHPVRHQHILKRIPTGTGPQAGAPLPGEALALLPRKLGHGRLPHVLVLRIHAVVRHHLQPPRDAQLPLLDLGAEEAGVRGRRRLADAQERDVLRELQLRHLAPAARELRERQRPHGRRVERLGARGADLGEQRDEGLRWWGWWAGGRLVGSWCVEARRGGARWGEGALAGEEEGEDIGVGAGGGPAGAAQEGEAAVAGGEGRGDEPRADVGLVAPEAGADEVAKGVDPAGARGQLSGEGDVWNLAQKGAVEGKAWEGGASVGGRGVVGEGEGGCLA